MTVALIRLKLPLEFTNTNKIIFGLNYVIWQNYLMSGRNKSGVESRKGGPRLWKGSESQSVVRRQRSWGQRQTSEGRYVHVGYHSARFQRGARWRAVIVQHHTCEKSSSKLIYFYKIKICYLYRAM